VLDGTMIGEFTNLSAGDDSPAFTSEPFPTPLMLVNNGTLYRTLPDSYAANLSAYQHADLPAYNLVVNGAEHLNLTDLQLMVAPPVFTLLGEQQAALGPIDPYVSARALNAYVLAFFDAALKDQPSPLLDGPAPAYSFVEFEARNP
jgi:hypothetical protein